MRPVLAAPATTKPFAGPKRRGGRARSTTVLAGCRRLAPGQRCAARRVSSGGIDSSARRRPDGAALEPAGEDVLDRLRRAGVRRARARAARRASTSAPTITSSSSSPTALAILDELISHFDEPFADSSAIPDVVRVGDRPAPRHGRALGRRRRRAVRRLRPLPAASAGRRLRPLRAAGHCAGPRAIAAAVCRTASRGKNFLRHVGRDDRGRYLDAIRFFSADEKPALLSADVRLGVGQRSRNARWRVTSSASRSCRGRAR